MIESLFGDFEKTTFEDRQNYYKQFPIKEPSEFPTFFRLNQTGISLELPQKLAFGLRHFKKYMEDKGWRFDKQNVVDFELSDTIDVVQPTGVEWGHRQWDSDLSEYQSRINLPSLLEKLYYESGYITDNGDPVSLYKGCQYADTCWSGIDERKPDNENIKWSYLSFPWIGDNYYKKKIVVLGINTNEGGGFNYNKQIVTEARDELGKGKVRIDFGYYFPNGEKYFGTYIWHRIACYTMAVREALNCNGLNDELNKLSQLDKLENIEAEYENNVFLNHIKCSPTGERSKPSTSMWKNCGAHVLRRELKILSPKYLVVLGVGDNIHYLKNKVFEGYLEEVNSRSKVKLYYTEYLGMPLKVIAVPHPSSSIELSLISEAFDAALQAKSI